MPFLTDMRLRKRAEQEDVKGIRSRILPRRMRRMDASLKET